jgi:hypothetical protein
MRSSAKARRCCKDSTRPASLRFGRAERTSSATASLVQVLCELQLRTRPIWKIIDTGTPGRSERELYLCLIWPQRPHFGSWREYVVAGDLCALYETVSARHALAKRGPSCSSCARFAATAHRSSF